MEGIGALAAISVGIIVGVCACFGVGGVVPGVLVAGGLMVGVICAVVYG